MDPQRLHIAMFGRNKELRLRIEGMTCGHCQATVAEALSRVKGVKDAEVDLAAGRARVEAKAGVEPTALVAAVEAAGYTAHAEDA